MVRLLQTNKRIDVVFAEEITPVARSSKETLPVAPRNKVSWGSNEETWCLPEQLSHEPWTILAFHAGYLKILEIPKGARHLLVQEFKGTPHILGKRRKVKFISKILASGNMRTRFFFPYRSGKEPGNRSPLPQQWGWAPCVPSGDREGSHVGVQQHWRERDHPDDRASEIWSSAYGQYITVVSSRHWNSWTWAFIYCSCRPGPVQGWFQGHSFL